MKEVAVFIPTYNRAANIWRVIANLSENTPRSLFTPYLIAEKSDTETITTARDLGCPLLINTGNPCYADCINSAYQQTQEPYFFTGADDLGFYVGWLEQALSHMKKGVGIVGTNDMGQIPIGQERDATHYLVARQYIIEKSGRIDMPNTVLYPYLHNYTDKEFIETGRKRNAYVYCPESKVEHLHWAWGKAQMDDTYRKGFNTNSQDLATYEARRHLWQ